jgi:outer membrane protein assembly factor BamB
MHLSETLRKRRRAILPRATVTCLLPLAGLTFDLFSRAAAAPPPTARLIASTEPGWPQFRGPRRDGVCDERGLLSTWPEGGPARLWSVTNLGRGFSSPVIAQGRLFITGDVGEDLRLYTFDLEGRPLWQATNGAAWTGPYPGARASVTCSAGRLYHQNAHGRLACLDAATGREHWAVDLLERFGGQNITWGLSECALVDDQVVYATAGGREALFVALDKATGQVRWQSKPLFDSEGERALENAGYASPILVQFGDRRLLIGCSLRHLVCVDADTGQIQWTQRFPTAYSVLALMPVLVGDAVFLTAPHGKGGRLLQLLAPAQPGSPVGVRELWRTSLDSLQGGVVHRAGRLYGAYYPGRKGWAAVDAATGQVLYDAPEFTKGAVLAAEDRLYALCEDGWMLLLQPGETSFQVRGRFRLAEARARDAWAHPVIHQGRLYLRYHERLVCYRVREP